LANELHWKFIEGDQFHSKSNLEKMSQGIPLADADRLPWLKSLRSKLEECILNNENAVLACSALKNNYREILIPDASACRLAYLKGPIELIQKRMENRKDHFMPVSLVKSQFDTLEEPKEAIVVEVNQEPRDIISELIQGLALK
jgi:gluconokinase